MTKKNVLVVGTGTIGEPLIGLLCSFKEQLSIGDIFFHKRTPLREEVARVNSLIRRGGKLVVNNSKIAEFTRLDHQVQGDFEHALNASSVIIDCTPAGNENKEDIYLSWSERDDNKKFIAQGSEKGFGLPYAYGINDAALLESDSQFVQVVSCNTHNMACLINSLDSFRSVKYADFVCIRRANDVSQDFGFVASPVVDKHEDTNFGTHHARDVHDLFITIGKRFLTYSSSMKTNSQYMHTIRFKIELTGHISLEQVKENFQNNKMISLTHRRSINRVFSFGRDQGFYGRIYNQTVVPIESLSVNQKSPGITEIVGFCFTPQDGNSILSSVAATIHAIHGADYQNYMKCFDKLLHNEI